MAVHYLTKYELPETFKGHITKNEAEDQLLWSTITIAGDQIVIIEDPKFSKSNLFIDNKDEK